MITMREHSGTDVLDFHDNDKPQHLDLIINKLKEKFNITIEGKLDDPGATLWDITVNNYNFTLVSGTYGNYLRPENEVSRKYLHDIFSLMKILFY
jgi:hypothetical protein